MTEAVVVQGYKRMSINATVVGSIFNCYGNEAKLSVWFHHSTRNASRIRQTFPLPTLLCAGYSVKLIKKIIDSIPIGMCIDKVSFKMCIYKDVNLTVTIIN